MSAPQSPPPCPDWCVSRHSLAIIGASFHRSVELVSGMAASVQIEQMWDLEAGLAEPVISLLIAGHDAKAIELSRAQAQALASQMPDPIAAALRQAADGLERITSGGGQ